MASHLPWIRSLWQQKAIRGHEEKTKNDHNSGFFPVLVCFYLHASCQQISVIGCTLMGISVKYGQILT